MVILLILVFTLLSIACYLSSGTIDLGNKLYSNHAKRNDKDSNFLVKTVMGVSSKALKFLGFIFGLVRDFLVWIGSFILIIDVIVFLLIVSAAYISIQFTELPSEDVSNNVSIEESIDK